MYRYMWPLYRGIEGPLGETVREDMHVSLGKFTQYARTEHAPNIPGQCVSYTVFYTTHPTHFHNILQQLAICI